MNGRFDHMLRVTRDRNSCTGRLALKAKEIGDLPFDYQVQFQSSLGVDKCLTQFVRHAFKINLSKEQSEQVLSGCVTHDNPLLNHKDGDVLIKHLCDYVSLSRDIRSAFSIDFEGLMSEQDVFSYASLKGDMKNGKIYTFYAPVESKDGVQIEDLVIRVDVDSSLFNPTGEAISHTLAMTSSILDARITLLRKDKSVGYIDANIMTCDNSIFQSNGCRGDIKPHFRNSVFMHDAMMLDESLGDALEQLNYFATSNANSGVKSQLSIVDKFFASRASSSRNVLLHIKDVDIKGSLRCYFTDILDSLRCMFEDPAQCLIDTYASVTNEYDAVNWSLAMNEESVVEAYNRASSEIRISGVSVITAKPSFSWWFDSLMSYMPDLEATENDTLILIDKPVQCLDDIDKSPQVKVTLDDLLLSVSEEKDVVL